MTTDPSQHKEGVNEPIRRTNQSDFRVDPDSSSLDSNRIEGSLSRKTAAGGGVGLLVGLVSGLKLGEGSLLVTLVAALCTCVIGAFVGAALSFKDKVDDQTARGEPVGLLMRITFGLGIVSVILVWVPLIIAVTIGATFLLTMF